LPTAVHLLVLANCSSFANAGQLLIDYLLGADVHASSHTHARARTHTHAHTFSTHKVSTSDDAGDSPLHIAIWKHQPKILKALLNAGAAEFENWNALHLAVATKAFRNRSENDWRKCATRFFFFACFVLACFLRVKPSCDESNTLCIMRPHPHDQTLM
jgi:ankyrin repeat protein